MVGDQFKKVQSGDKLEIPAAAWNALMELAQKAKMADMSRVDLARLAARIPCLTALVKNNSQADRNVFDYVVIRGSLSSGSIQNPHEFARTPVLWGDAPSYQDDIGRPVAVYLEPCKAGELGLAVVNGLTLARVENYNWRKVIDITPNDCTKLQAVDGRSGVARPIGTFDTNENLYAIWLTPSAITTVLGYFYNLGSQYRMKLDPQAEESFPAANLAGDYFWGVNLYLNALRPADGMKLPFFRMGDEETWQFFCPPELAGIDQTVSIDTPNAKHWLTFEKGHLVLTQTNPLASGVIEVGGDIVPGDAAGRFFPVPGLWNGMPQWQNAQNPNVWIRWIPLPGGGGRWAIGWWPADAVQGQLPNWGWAHPIPPAGQPPQQNPIAPFPDAIGDVQGEPWTWQHDYVLEDCTTGQRYILVGSASRLWPRDSVIRWKLGDTVHCAKVISMWDWRDLPEVENPHIYIYEDYFWTCDECYAIDRVVQDCDGARRFLLEGNSYYQWPTGHVVKWMDPQGQIHCSRILSLQETWYHEKLSVGAWAYLMLLDSCDRCKNDECPSHLSCPSQPSQPWCSPYYACLCASGVILPSSAVGVYPIQSGTVGGKCWWKKGDWIIYFSPGAGTWFLFNLNNPDLYWYRSSSDPVGVYQPHPNHTAGIAFVGKTP